MRRYNYLSIITCLISFRIILLFTTIVTISIDFLLLYIIKIFDYYICIMC